MAHLLEIDQAFENMSVHEISTSHKEISTTLLSGKIISDHTHSTSSSSPIILPNIDEGNMISNAWDLHVPLTLTLPFLIGRTGIRTPLLRKCRW
ncbi:hypothetical protein RHMOL_Rhmol07G0145300 [Rhododendron molle]|uniref:Uncharacterized protein n=1 Tax=Rhododendron molle TaxID=49168 RepID=A0ACC0N1P6_RHOML|nr:hypothetical protein RHMOL_Rhmol07G0145300 [Rhododendron molle]